MSTPVIDAHQHFWDPASGACGWMTDAFAPIHRVFTPADLAPELATAGVDATILVQCWHSVAETEAFLETAACTGFIAGVVGWVDMTAPGVDDALARLKARPDGRYLVGVRHLVHDEADADWLLRPDVRRGLAAVARHGLAYDLLVRLRDLPAALRTVADFPELRFVVDHIAKPAIRDRAFDPWARATRSFAAHRDHVWCKLSGMVTEADWSGWTNEDLKPYIAEALGIFGPARCLFGSDWPVCLMAASYGDVLAMLREAIAALAPDEQAMVLGGSALSLYRPPQVAAPGLGAGAGMPL